MITATCSQMPTKLDASNTDRIVVSPNKLSVKYPENDEECCVSESVQSNKPVPVNCKTGYYYFEMQVKNVLSSSTRVSLGYTTEDFDVSSLPPGMQNNSVGYHGDDGNIFLNGRKCGSPCPTYTINDIVGAGVDYVSNEFFFTKNGMLVGAVSKKVNGPLFPTVGLFGQNMEVKVNFGHKPFAYDIETRYSCPCSHSLVNDDSESTTTIVDSKSSNEDCWKKLMEKSETLLRKSVEEKEKDLASLKAILNAMSDNFHKYMY